MKKKPHNQGNKLKTSFYAKIVVCNYNKEKCDEPIEAKRRAKKSLKLNGFLPNDIEALLNEGC